VKRFQKWAVYLQSETTWLFPPAFSRCFIHFREWPYTTPPLHIKDFLLFFITTLPTSQGGVQGCTLFNGLSGTVTGQWDYSVLRSEVNNFEY